MNSKKILVVDDSLVILKTLAQKLRGQGYEVLTAEDGSTAVSLARHEQPDLILTDVNFPPDAGNGGGVSWDGFLLMDSLHRMAEARHIPVAIMTSDDPGISRKRALSAGAVAFFEKPLDHQKLLATISQLFQKQPASC